MNHTPTTWEKKQFFQKVIDELPTLTATQMAYYLNNNLALRFKLASLANTPVDKKRKGNIFP